MKGAQIKYRYFNYELKTKQKPEKSNIYNVNLGYYPMPAFCETGKN